jgi:hypothetical protein
MYKVVVVHFAQNMNYKYALEFSTAEEDKYKELPTEAKRNALAQSRRATDDDVCLPDWSRCGLPYTHVSRLYVLPTVVGSVL